MNRDSRNRATHGGPAAPHRPGDLNRPPEARSVRALRRTAGWLVVAIVLALAFRTWSADPDAGTETAGAAAAPASGNVAPARRARAATPAEAPATDPDSLAPADPDAPVVRRVRVVDADRRPVQGARVSWDRGPGIRSAGTDAAGIVEIRVHGDDPPECEVEDGRGTHAVVLDREEVEVVVETYPLLEITAFDAWTLRAVVCTGADLVVSVEDDTTDVTLDASALAGWRLPLARSRVADVRVRMHTPPGWVAIPDMSFAGTVALRSRRARFSVPVYPETRRVVRAVDAAGEPVAGAIVSEVSVPWGGASEVSCLPLIQVRSSESGADGRIEIDGLPRLPRGQVLIELTAPASRGGSVGAISIPTAAQTDDAVTDIDVTAGRAPRVPPPEARDVDDHRFGCGNRDDPVPFKVRAVDRLGEPAPGVSVRIGPDELVTGPDGTAARDRIESGKWRFSAWGQGFLPAFGIVEVTADGTLDVREGDGRRVRVTVLDADSRPVCGARVAVDSWGLLRPDGHLDWTEYRVGQFDGNVEILAPRTGPDGSVTLVVPHGRMWYGAAALGEVGRDHSASDDVIVRLGAVAKTREFVPPELQEEWGLEPIPSDDEDEK